MSWNSATEKLRMERNMPTGTFYMICDNYSGKCLDKQFRRMTEATKYIEMLKLNPDNFRIVVKGDGRI